MSVWVGKARLPRSAGLDAARALAVFAMVFGHCADALIATSMRDTAAFLTYSTFRGMTAPAFLFVSGWAVATRDLRSLAAPGELVGAHWRRAGTLLLAALALRFPAWDLAGLLHFHAAPWRHWLGMDALFCIGASLALSSAVLPLRISPALRGLLCALAAMAAPRVAAVLEAHALPLPLEGWFHQTSESPFPVFPWSGFFFGGAAAACGVHLVSSRKGQAALLLSLGLVGVVAAEAIGLDRLPLSSSILFMYRLGFAAAVGGLMLAIPDPWIRWATPIGKASLLTYIVHVPLLYGWGHLGGLRALVGPTLTVWQVALVAFIFVCLGASISMRKESQSITASSV